MRRPHPRNILGHRTVSGSLLALSLACSSPSPAEKEAEQNTAEPASDDGALGDKDAEAIEAPRLERVDLPTESGAKSENKSENKSESESESGSGSESSDAETETGPSEASQARAKTDLERAGNLALDLSEALKSGKIENLLALTPLDEGEFAKACQGSDLIDKREVIARAKHCLRSIDWSAVSDVRVTGGESLGEASECEGYEAMQRVRMLVVSSQGNTEIDLHGAFGRDGQAMAFSGAIVCKPQGSN